MTDTRKQKAVKDEWVQEVCCDCGQRSSQAVKDERVGEVCCDCGHRFSQAVKDEGVGKVRCDCEQALRHFAFCPAGPHNAHPAGEGPGKQIHVVR